MGNSIHTSKLNGESSSSASSALVRAAQLVLKGMRRSGTGSAAEAFGATIHSSSSFTRSYKTPTSEKDQTEFLILQQLQIWGRCSPRDLVNSLPGSQPTIQRKLRSLLGQGLVQRFGATSGVQYKLTSKGRQFLVQEEGV